MVEIIHFGDLHYGDKKEFREEWLLNVIDYINDNRPDAAICTGDIVHKGLLRQYKGVLPYLEKIKVPLMVVLGNHDCKANGIISFERYIMPRRSKMILEDKDTIIIGLNSSKGDSSEGEIGDEQLEWCAMQFNKILEDSITNENYETSSIIFKKIKELEKERDIMVEKNEMK